MGDEDFFKFCGCFRYLSYTYSAHSRTHNKAARSLKDKSQAHK